MAFGDPYATIAELEARLGMSDNGTFDMLLHAASRQVEAYTRRQFNRADDDYATERRFRALDLERLPVDDFHTLEGLVVEADGVQWEDENLDARPWNGIVDGIPGWPFFDLFAVNRYWPLNRRATVYVTAQWGWAAVPAGIIEATLSVATVMAGVAGVGSTTSGIIRSEAVDGYAVSYAVPEISVAQEVPAVLAAAAPYRRKRFGVA